MKFIIILLLMFSISLLVVNAQQFPRLPIIANTFFFNTSETSSTTYQTIGSDIFEVTRSTPISFIRSSFQATKITGTDALDDFIWRILLDGVEVVNSTQSLENQETAPIELQAGLGNLELGFHNITFQHKVITETLRTSDISFSILTNQFLNGSSLPLANESINFTVPDIEVFTKFDEFTFTKLRNDSNIFMSIFGQVSSIDSNVDLEIKIRINDEESGIVSTGLQDPDELKFITYSWFFKNVEIGSNTVEVFARNLQNIKVTSFNGDISFAETIVDDIEANINDSHVGTFVTSSTIPVLVDSFLINVSTNSTLVIISESTVTKSTSGKDNITMFIDTSGFGTVFNHTIQLEGAADIGNFPFVEVPPNMQLVWGMKNISLFAFVESTTATFTNTSFFAIEIKPIEVLATVDNPPVCSLISPPDNTFTNESNVTFIINVTDDVRISNLSLFHNHSGIFVLNETATVNANFSAVTFNKTIPFNSTIVWNGFVTDNISQSSICNLNFTLTLNQTFPPDTTPPVITLISPENNSVNNTIPLNITFQVTDNSGRLMICELNNNTFLFDTGTFNQGVDQNLTLAKGSISLSQNFPNLNLICFDNSELNNSATLNLNFTLDTIPPIIFPISPGDTEKFNKELVSNINIKANCTDVPLFRFNITISNSSNTIASFETKTTINNFAIIDEQLNINNLGVGNYTIDYICSDPHTKKNIPNYFISKNNKDNLIKWSTPSGNEYELKYNDQGVHVLDYGSSKDKNNDRYYFWFNLNESPGTERIFTFELENKKHAVIYLPDSKYNGHFITENNWIDFEFNDPEAEYIITLNQNNNYEIQIKTIKTLLNFTSTGELNIATLQTEFEIFSFPQAEDFLSKTTCSDTIPSMMLLGLLAVISFVTIIMGLHFNVGIIGFFGSLLLIVLSWFVAACIGIFGFLLAVLGIVMAFMFLWTGLRIPTNAVTR